MSRTPISVLVVVDEKWRGHERIRRKKEVRGSVWGRLVVATAATVRIVKNNSDRRSCGSCKHEVPTMAWQNEHIVLYSRIRVRELVIRRDFAKVMV